MNNITANKTSKMLLSTEDEIFNKLVEQDNPFRYLNEHFDFVELANSLSKCYSELGTTGIAVEKGFRALLVQFWEDYSDRQMERSLRHNVVVRWFCGFGLMENTPDHSYFGKLRKRIGPNRLAEIFHKVNEAMKKKNLFGEVFTFIDASSIITKTALWEERDKALAAGEEKLKNANIVCWVPHEVSSLVQIGWEEGLIKDLEKFLGDIAPPGRWTEHDEPGTPLFL